MIDPWMPLFLFAVLFGLSMDYHVFLLSRIRERYDETRTPRRWPTGCVRPPGLLAAATLIVVVVFGAFATGRTIVNQLMGFGLAVAVLLDATLVRSILVPASMEVMAITEGRGRSPGNTTTRRYDMTTRRLRSMKAGAGAPATPVRRGRWSGIGPCLDSVMVRQA